MSDSLPDRIAVTFNMTVDDYARYFAIVNRQESGWAGLLAFVAALFGAIPVALMFRSIGVRLSHASAAVDSIGYLSLAAFLLGAFAMLVAGLGVRRVAFNTRLAGTLNAFDSKTAVFDATGVALTGRISQAMWQWAAVSRITRESDLLLIWIGRWAAVVIPCRSFGSNSACKTADAFVRARLSEAASGPIRPAMTPEITTAIATAPAVRRPARP
jgi:hypothetical protein